MEFATERIKEGRTATRAFVLSSTLLLIFALNWRSQGNARQALANVNSLRILTSYVRNMPYEDRMRMLGGWDDEARPNSRGRAIRELRDWLSATSEGLTIRSPLLDIGVFAEFDEARMNEGGGWASVAFWPEEYELLVDDLRAEALIELLGKPVQMVATRSEEEWIELVVESLPENFYWLAAAPGSASGSVVGADGRAIVMAETTILDDQHWIFTIARVRRPWDSDVSHRAMLSRVAGRIDGEEFSEAEFLGDLDVFKLSRRLTIGEIAEELEAEVRKQAGTLKVFGVPCPSELVVFGGPILVMFSAIYSWIFATAALRCIDAENRSFPWALLLETGVARAANVATLVMLPIAAFTALGLRASSGQFEVAVLLFCAAVSTICGFGVVQRASRL